MMHPSQGGSYLDIYQHHGIGEKSFYPIVEKCLDAIIAEFPFCFPANDKDALEALAEKNVKRANGVMTGCVGELDGLAVKLEKPRLTDAPDPARLKI
jgi:hypothetical protein